MIKIDKIFDPLTKMITGKSSRTTKKSYRYKVTVKGVQVSKHYTKAAAISASARVKGARVVKLTTKRRK